MYSTFHPAKVVFFSDICNSLTILCRNVGMKELIELKGDYFLFSKFIFSANAKIYGFRSLITSAPSGILRWQLT